MTKKVILENLRWQGTLDCLMHRVKNTQPWTLPLSHKVQKGLLAF